MNFDFLDNKNVQLLFSIFEKNKNNLFIVGGAVRNTFANFPITDIDFCTSVKPDNIIKILKMNNIEYSDIGKKFGTALSNKAAIFGGAILIIIGIQIFIKGVIA